MKNVHRIIAVVAGLLVAEAGCALAQDWPQWRGPNRDGKASGFAAPKNWPKELTQKWRVTVGAGDATPALAGDRLYVFARAGEEEVTRCLDAATGKELWKESYAAQAVSGPASGHSGPRSSPTVTGGKVVTYGVGGILSCLDAASGKKLWRKDEFPGQWPRFYTAASPLVVDGMCVAQLGGEEKGGIAAYDLGSGELKWKWTEEGTAYASPAILDVSGTRMVVALTPKQVVGIGIADGKLLWKAPFAAQGRNYNAATPIVNGQTVLYAGAGRGTKAVRIEKNGNGFAAKELWSNPDSTVQFNSPVLKDGQVYGISKKGDLFCLDAKEGKTLWTTTVGGNGFGSVVDAGSVLLALTPEKELAVFTPSDKEYKKLAGYKVAETEPYACPIATSKGLYVKDRTALTLWAFE